MRYIIDENAGGSGAQRQGCKPEGATAFQAFSAKKHAQALLTPELANR